MASLDVKPQTADLRGSLAAVGRKDADMWELDKLWQLGLGALRLETQPCQVGSSLVMRIFRLVAC